MAARKSTGTRTRFEVFKRDNFTCQYCGRTPPAVILHIDHIVPVSKGGGNDQLNLITACFECNLGKSNKPLSQVIAPISDQMEKEIERKKQIEAFNKFLMKRRKETDSDVTELGWYWCNFFKEKKNHWEFGTTRIATIKRFLTFIPKATIMESMDIAMSRVPVIRDNDESTFKYFCGICWKKIRTP